MVSLLIVLFYYPLVIVLLEAFTVHGEFTGRILYTILTSEFYFGWLPQFIAHPIETVRRVPSGTLGLFGFTAYQAILSTIASVLLGLPGAYLLARFEFPGRKTIRSLTILPFVMPSIIVAIGFVAMFGENGALNDALRLLGLPTLDLMFTLKIIILAHAFYNAPLITRMTAAAWESVDRRLIETARSMGASPFRAFIDVILPQLIPSILTGALLTFIFTFLSFPIILALGGLKLATVEVMVYHNINLLNYSTAAGLALLEMSISLILTYAYLRYEARQMSTRESIQTQARIHLFGPLTIKRLLVFGYTFLAAIIFLGPIISMVIESFTGGQGLTLRNYMFLVQRQLTGYDFQVQPLNAIINSLLFAIGSLLIALPMGIFLAIISTRDFRGRKFIDAITMAPLAVSGVVVGLGLLRGLVFGITIGGYRITVTGALAIIGAHAVAAYPFVTRNVVPLLESVDSRLVESARALGASRLTALIDIELPLVYSGIIAGAAFAFAISIGEFDATIILIQGGDWYTMPIAIERYIGRRLGPATAMGCVLLAVTAMSFIIIDRVGGRWYSG
ncbi:MAG: ABC transporter permease [Halobacteriaceae archaeon]